MKVTKQNPFPNYSVLLASSSVSWNTKLNKSNIRSRYFAREDLGFSADFIILRHTLEHIPNPVGFLKEIFAINGNDKAVIFIEVPCFDWIRDQGAYWDLTIEHCNYFTAESFRTIFCAPSIEKLFEQQYLFVTAKLKDIQTVDHFQDFAQGDLAMEIGSLFPSLDPSRSNLIPLRDQALSVSRDYWVWGAATKGVMFLWHKNLLLPASPPPLGLVDINPGKQGRYIGGLGYKVICPEEFFANAKDGDTVIVVNPAYLQEVRQACCEATAVDLSFVALGAD